MSRKFVKPKISKTEPSSVVASLGPIQGGAPKPERRSQRQLRVGELIRHALATLLVRQQLRHPLMKGSIVTITEVQVSVDLKHAFVLVMISRNHVQQEVLKALAQSAGEMQHHLGKMVSLTAIPRLKFGIDTLLEEAARLEKVFQDPHVRQDLENVSLEEAESLEKV